MRCDLGREVFHGFASCSFKHLPYQDRTGKWWAQGRIDLPGPSKLGEQGGDRPSQNVSNLLKFLYSDKAKKFEEIKGQLILKCFFWYFQFSQKMNQKIGHYYYGTSSRIVCVRFLRKLKTPKRHFEITWPLRRRFLQILRPSHKPST